jgi:probable rRNA maturation factor
MIRAVQLSIDRVVRRRVSASLRRALQRHVARIVRVMAGPSASVEVRICDDAAMATLHAASLGDPRPTDVLSFPAGPPLPRPDGAFSETPRESLGAIVINWDAVARQARGHDPAAVAEEATSLSVHSVAHLVGHDHATRAQARRMLAVERRLGRRIGLRVTRPYGAGH